MGNRGHYFIVLLRDQYVFNESKGWNRSGRISIPSDLTVYSCANVEELQNIITTTRCVSLNIRGGGHCYNNTSLQGGATILYNNTCFSPLNKIRISISSTGMEMLEMQSNLRNGDVYLFLHNYRLKHNKSWDFPGGSCPNVGISGFLLGGGQTYIGAQVGSACHYLYGVDTVNADGKIMAYTQENHPEVMEVVRGGGHIKPFVVTKFILNINKLKAVKWQLVFYATRALTPADQTYVASFLLSMSDKFKDENVLGPINVYSAHAGAHVGRRPRRRHSNSKVCIKYNSSIP